MFPQSKEFVLEFHQGYNYHTMNQDSNSIFWAFNIPSWLHPSYKTRILNRIDLQQHSTTIFVVKLDTTPASRIQNYIKLYFYEVLRDNNLQRLQYYIQQQQGLLLRKNKVSVKLNKFPNEKMFNITIVDHQDFLSRKLSPVKDILYLIKNSEKLKHNMLEYNYIQPQNFRYKKQIKSDHFHLAFQGGGAKGIAYIGAYKAIKTILPNHKVTSVIGSSAGSMCALAIASNMTPQNFMKLFITMDQIPKDRTIKSQKDVTPQVVANHETIKIKIRQFLHDYGLIPNTCCNYLCQSYLNDEQLIHEVFSYFLGDNQSLKDMLSMPIEPTYFNKHFKKQVEEDKLINFFGLFQGKLLAGNKIFEITDTVIKGVLNQIKQQNPFLFYKVLGNNAKTLPIDQLVKTVNLYQYYQFTGVELTCTGTDLDSKVLRFFNQKTTPYLPIRMAVVLSSSYPVAFEARKWKKQWGKYYLHHAQTRLQIDVTGHQFSDGGILANLPVMYLDNQQMRPILFSHMKTPLTQIFGFGLDEIKTQTISPQIQKKNDKIRTDLIWKVIGRTPLCGLCCYTCCCVPSNQNFSSLTLTNVNQIPILSLAKKIIQTYRHANTNLVMQIFRKDIYHFSSSSQVSNVIKFQITPKLLMQYKNIRQSLLLINVKLQTMKIQQFGLLQCFRIIRETIPTLQNIYEIIRIKKIYQQLFKIFMLFCYQQKSRLHYSIYQNNNSKTQKQTIYQINIEQITSKIQQITFFIQSVGEEERFVNNVDFLKQQKKLYDISSVLSKLQQSIEYPNNHLIKQDLKNFYQSFFSYYKQYLENKVHGLVQDLNIKIIELEFALSSGVKVLQTTKKIKQLHKFYDSFKLFRIKQFEQFQKHFYALQQPFIKTKRLYLHQEDAVIYYIDKKINRRTSSNIHIVLQGRGVVPQLNLLAFKTVQQYLKQMQIHKEEEFLEQIATLIMNDEANIKKKKYEIIDIFTLILVKRDLKQKLKLKIKNLEQIQILDLQYLKFKIRPHLQKRLIEKKQKRKNQICKITNVTTSGITSFLMLMTILGFEDDKIQDNLNILSHFIYLSPFKIQKKFQSYSWAIPRRCRIQQLQQAAWDQRFEIFKAMQLAIMEQKLPLNFEQLIQQFEQSRDGINQTFVILLNYISQSYYKSNLTKDSKEFFAQKMSIDIVTQNFHKSNRQISIATKAMIKSFVQIFQNQIKLSIFMSGDIWIKDILTEFPDPALQDWMYKGLIIENLLETYLVKRQLKKIFSQKNINPQIKLKDFYRISPLKITLTFNAVDLAKNKYVFINHITHPQLPLWMALTSTAYLPLIFPKVIVRSHYLDKINPSEAQRNLEILIKQGHDEQFKHLYTSGNMLDPLPLDLLTSQQTRKNYFQDKQFTFLSFGSQINNLPNQSQMFERRFLKFQDFMKLICTGLSTGFNIKPGRIFTDKTAMIQTYLNAHDNYIYQIFTSNLLRLPVKMGVLDFHKLNSKQNLGELTLFETQLCTFQKFSTSRKTWIQFELLQNKLLINFLSRDLNNNDLLSKYRVQFKTNSTSNYDKITKRSIQLNLEFQHQLFLRFNFVQNKKIVQREFCFDIISLIYHYNMFKATYLLEYQKVLNTYIPPFNQPVKIPRGTTITPPIDMLLVQSLVNIEKTGLYCQLCSSQLIINKLYYTLPANKNKCFHCKQIKQTRFICNNKSRNCNSIYCMMCCSNFYFKKQHEMKCSYNHVMQFRNQRNQQNNLLDHKITFVRCSRCLQSAKEFYYDNECDTTICLKCCSKIILKQ